MLTRKETQSKARLINSIAAVGVENKINTEWIGMARGGKSHAQEMQSVHL